MAETRAPGGRLTLDAVAKAYAGKPAVDALSVSVEPGEFFTVLGPSGCGKTTTLMMVAGFTEPDSGRILLDQRDITRLPTHRREIGVVFQNYAMFPHMTVAENVGFSLKMRDVPNDEVRRRVGQALELVQLTGREADYPRELSGGQQQRVALARALVFQPLLLLLDEPLGALDRMLREDMKLELRRVHSELGTTMIYVTHDQDEALVLSDRIMVMNAGGIAQIGSPQEIYERPATPFVARFIGESNFLDGSIVGVAGDAVTVALDTGGTVRGTSLGRLSTGGRAIVAVRPEKIVIAAPDDRRDGLLPGRIIDCIYSGDSMRDVVDLGGGKTVTARHIRRAGAARPAKGESVRLSWAAEDAIVYAGP